MRTFALAVLVVAAAPSALAQHNEFHSTLSVPFVVPSAALPSEPEPFSLPRAAAQGTPARQRWWAPLASAAAPGSGQAVLGQRRWLPYLALEIWAWIQYADARRDSRRHRRGYQAIARDVARSQFPGPYPTGDFEYYEHMLKNVESGDFDVVPGGEIDPETDTTTYNGRRWLDARRLFWENPEIAPPPESEPYARAVDFYEINAIPTEYRWSWRSAQLEYDSFRRTIVRSNVAYKRSVAFLGVIIANHALSAVDAFVTLRLRTRADIPGQLELEGHLPISSILPRH
jgi:hypothetical protein